MPDLAEPTTVALSSIPPSSTVAAASEAAAQSQSASSSLKDALRNLPPAKEEPTQAQQASATETPPVEKKAFPPVGKSDVKEQKQVESRTDVAEPEGSALESFRTDLNKARRKKEREFLKSQNEERSQKTQQAESTDTDTPPVEQKTTEATTDDSPVTDEEITKTINDPAISKRHQKRMVHLANKAKDLEKKLAEAQAKPQSDANDAKVKELTEREAAAQKELMQFRRRYSAESEPEIKKFDEVATKADEAIYGKLKEAGLSDKTVELIKSMGGFDGFSRSNQVFTINVRGEDGEVAPQQVTAAQLARKWLTDMNVADAEYVKTKLGERFSALDGKKNRIAELAADAENFFKSQGEQAQKAQEAQQKVIQEYRSAYDKKTAEWLAKQELLKDKQIPANASPEEKQEIERYNKHNEGIRKMIAMAAAPTSVDDHVSIVQEAAQSLIFSRENSSLKKEVAALKEQLGKIQKGITTTGKPGSASIQTAPKKTDDSAKAQLATPVTESLREAMEKLRLGQSED